MGKIIQKYNNGKHEIAAYIFLVIFAIFKVLLLVNEEIRSMNRESGENLHFALVGFAIFLFIIFPFLATIYSAYRRKWKCSVIYGVVVLYFIAVGAGFTGFIGRPVDLIRSYVFSEFPQFCHIREETKGGLILCAEYRVVETYDSIVIDVAGSISAPYSTPYKAWSIEQKTMFYKSIHGNKQDFADSIIENDCSFFQTRRVVGNLYYMKNRGCLGQMD